MGAGLPAGWLPAPIQAVLLGQGKPGSVSLAVTRVVWPVEPAPGWLLSPQPSGEALNFPERDITTRAAGLII